MEPTGTLKSRHGAGASTDKEFHCCWGRDTETLGVVGRQSGGGREGREGAAPIAHGMHANPDTP